MKSLLILLLSAKKWILAESLFTGFQYLFIITKSISISDTMFYDILKEVSRVHKNKPKAQNENDITSIIVLLSSKWNRLLGLV